ncbi:PR-1-like protein [Rhizoclosmatium globosum]|uniref:PR-1-like protein n=1 Tax=Rhizoclosmatium globosum TaxID=329046 RepID=A0A1Y2CZG6_9FUNG|nr:PR-1-like protein [Rhizoclosmatium globosum]|eukprot:ORY52419.1 PR-1-like protein [Rhizoclosmatium globosum]
MTPEAAKCNTTLPVTGTPTCQQLADLVVISLNSFQRLNPQADCSKPIHDAYVCAPPGFNVTLLAAAAPANAPVFVPSGSSHSVPSSNSTNPSAAHNGTNTSDTSVSNDTLAPVTSTTTTSTTTTTTTTTTTIDPTSVVEAPALTTAAAVAAPAAPAVNVGAMSAQDVIDITNAHNNYRASLGMPSVSFDYNVASTAADWANYLASYGCMLEHGGMGPYGQNLAMQGGGSPSMQGLFDGWASECLDCGELNHATQAAWASTSSIGCATAWGSGGWCVVLVCDYNPAGNYVGRSWRTG